MVASRGTCPECGSSEVTKERIMGSQTGDLVCLSCKFSGCSSRFSSKPQKTKEE